MPKRKITPTHYELLIKIFELEGFIIKRKKGDHIIMTKRGQKTSCNKNQPKAYSRDAYPHKYDDCWNVQRAVF